VNKNKLRIVSAVICFTASAAAGAAGETPATAAAPAQTSITKARTALQSEVNATLERTKGGKQISANAIEWTVGQGGTVIEQFPVPAALAHDPQTQWSLKNNVIAVQQGDRRRASAAAVHGIHAAKPATARTPYTTDYDHGCPSGVFDQWYCFYQNANFNGVAATGTQGPGNGRMLEWSDEHVNFVDFNSYNFRDQTSSWVNTGSYTITAWNWFTDPYGETLWTEPPASRSGYVGDYANDKADGFWTN
jgi:hypothetical protein